MSRNLTEISANGIALKAAALINIVVIAFALIYDHIGLWMLSVIASLVVIAFLQIANRRRHRALKEARRRSFARAATANRSYGGGPAEDPAYGPMLYPPRHREAAVAVAAADAERVAQQRRRRAHGLQLVLLETYPICLN